MPPVPKLPVPVAPGRLAFAVRCAFTAAAAPLLAQALGLPHPVWASMSGLIVSQESLEATRSSIAGRVAGTILGAAIAVLVGIAGRHQGLALEAQIASAVAICARLVKGRPTLRVCLWTCPVVLLTGAPEPSIAHVGVMRASEVILGALLGGIVHRVSYELARRFAPPRSAGRP